MKNINRLLACLGIMVFCFVGAPPSAHASVAGYVQFVKGEVQLTTADGKIHRLQKGDAVNEGDTLTSANTASAQIKMQDGGFVAMRPETQLKFDSFKFSGKEDGTEQSFFSLFRGGFRAVTGLIGRINKATYRITTPTSTIGIRGTDHESFVVVPGSEIAAVAPAGAYNKVNIGETYMATDKGTIFVLPNQMGFAGALDQMPQLQPININIFTATPAPLPQANGGKKEDVRESAVVDTTAKKEEEEALFLGTGLTPPVPPVIQTISQQLPAQGQGGIAFFGTNAPNGYSSGFSDTVAYTSDIGLSAFTSMTTGFSGSRGTATVVDHGSVALNGGLEKMGWGRWAGTGATVTYPGGTGYPGLTMPVFNLQYVGGSPVPVMPGIGMANYIPVGGTGPFDSSGNIGQFTGATVTANFSTATLSVGMNMSFGGIAYAANGSGRFAANGVIPITLFSSVGCTPACSPSPAMGEYAGAFVGTNAAGLGLVYHVTNPNTMQDIAGARAFVRQ